MKRKLTIREVEDLGYQLSRVIVDQFQYRPVRAFAIPRGGIPALFAIMRGNTGISYTENPEDAHFFIDDIIDSGSTMVEWCDKYPGKPFYALIDKTDATCEFKDDWIIFPWETDDQVNEDDTIVGTITNRILRSGEPFFANDNISKFIHSTLELTQLQHELGNRIQSVLKGLIIDVENDHNTQGTAERIAKMYINEVFKGRYFEAPDITSFPNAKHLDEMYMTGPITLRSACSHHFVPIVGKCWIGVVPGQSVIGLSKFNRLVEWIASRPQIQEELVMQIADYIETEIQPKGLAVVVEATHMCMTWRGVREPMTAKMTTNVMRGVFRDKPEARAEFMAMVAKAE